MEITFICSLAYSHKKSLRMRYIFVEEGKGIEWFLIEISRKQFGIEEDHVMDHTYWRANIGSATYQLFPLCTNYRTSVFLSLKLDTFYYYNKWCLLFVWHRFSINCNPNSHYCPGHHIHNCWVQVMEQGGLLQIMSFQ